MKCLHIVSGDLWAGAETATTALLAELRTRKNVEPAALLLNDGRMAEELRRSGVSISVACEASTGMLALGRTVRAAALALGAEIVHSHRYKEHLLGAWAVAGRRIAHVRTAHGLPPAIGLSGRGLAALADAALCRAGGASWIAVSDDLAARLRGAKQNVAVVRNGLPEAGPPPRPDLLASKAGAMLVGFVGRLEPIKRPDRFLEILAALGPKVGGIPVRGVVAGSGSLDAPMRALATERGLDGRVVFLGDADDGAAVVAALDILVVSSDHEGHPMVVLEAMRAGVPIVAARVGGLPEVLPADEFLPRAEDVGAFAAAVRRLLDDADLRRRRGADQRESFLRTFSVRATADRVLEVYREALGRRRDRR